MYKTLRTLLSREGGSLVFEEESYLIYFFVVFCFPGCPADAIVLEAPFTNMWVASINYPLLKVSLSFLSLRVQAVSTLGIHVQGSFL